MIRLAAGMSAGARRNLLTVCAMTATIMQALDTTVANVALPYMQGSLSASLDQINWVLTSYIVASAIMTAPIGWMSDRFGRKRLFVICCAGFTFASLLCASSQDIGSMVFARLLQGAFGAALVPLSQSVMLDAYPPEQRGQAMAIWGMGVMLGPILGPALGGFLTDLMLFMDETKKQEHLRFDWLGFIALAIGIGSLQLLLDRGEQVGWYDSPEIVVETIISVTGFYYFFAHSLTTEEPFVRFELFKDRNFAAACLFMVLIGVSLFGTMALITPYTQNLLGYPILTAGFVLGSRGVGTLVAMMAVGKLLGFIEARTLVFCGLTITAVTLYYMVGFTTDTSMQTIVVVGIVQGAGLGLVFVPLSTVAFATLPGHLRNSGTAMLTLVRNIGSSIGISMVIANLTSTTTLMHARLAEFINPFNNALQQASSILSTATDQGRALLDAMLTRQATVIAYDNTFKLLMVLTLFALPLVLLIGSSRTKPSAAPAQAHAMD